MKDDTVDSLSQTRRAACLRNRLSRRSVVLVVLILVCHAMAAENAAIETKVLYSQDFAAVKGEKPPWPIRDNSGWAGSRVPMRVVDRGDPRHGRMLECEVSGFCQIILGKIPGLRKGVVYRVGMDVSSRGAQRPTILLRKMRSGYTVYLSSEDWMPTEGPCPWSQAAVAQATPSFGFWPVEVAAAGTYRFEVRRWPRELDAPIIGVPIADKAPDAYVNDQPVLGTLYPAAPRAVAAAKVRLKVAEVVREAAISPADVDRVFTVELPSGPTRIETQLLDAGGEPLCGAYYVYARQVKKP